MAQNFFDKVYSTSGDSELRSLYDTWADKYDQDLKSQDYATPDRIAAALKRHLGADRPILDFACGTGLSGAALARAGFTTIDGYDLSQAMLDKARETGVYRLLILAEPGASLNVRPGDYDAIVACGAVSPGAAPPEAFDQIVEALAHGALFVVSFNDHALADPAYMGRREAALEDGRLEELSAEIGPHLRGLGSESAVYVFRRT